MKLTHQQGDVLLFLLLETPVFKDAPETEDQKLPEFRDEDGIRFGKRSLYRKASNRIVLRTGNGGHDHAILATDEQASIYNNNGTDRIKGLEKFEAILEVKVPVTLTHDEHKPQIIQPGVYGLDAVREIDPFTEAVSKVQD